MVLNKCERKRSIEVDRKVYREKFLLKKSENMKKKKRFELGVEEKEQGVGDMREWRFGTGGGVRINTVEIK
jgi:ribosomal protein S8E